MPTSMIRQAIMRGASTRFVNKALDARNVNAVSGFRHGRLGTLVGGGLLGGAMASNGDPTPINMWWGTSAAVTGGMAMAAFAPGGIQAASKRIGRIGSKRVAGSMALNSVKFTNKSAQIHRALAVPGAVANHSPINIYRPVSRPDFAAYKTQRWNPRMADAMVSGHTFGKRLESNTGRRALFASGAMLSGTLFNSSYITGSQRDHAYNSRSGNALR